MTLEWTSDLLDLQRLYDNMLIKDNGLDRAALHWADLESLRIYFRRMI